MNQIILNLMIINSIATIVYILYIIYEFRNNEIIVLLENQPDILDKYYKNKRYGVTFYILGVLLGLIYLIIMDNDMNIIKNPTNIVSDVSDIYVK